MAFTEVTEPKQNLEAHHRGATSLDLQEKGNGIYTKSMIQVAYVYKKKIKKQFRGRCVLQKKANDFLVSCNLQVIHWLTVAY